MEWVLQRTGDDVPIFDVALSRSSSIESQGSALHAILTWLIKSRSSYYHDSLFLTVVYQSDNVIDNVKQQTWMWALDPMMRWTEILAKARLASIRSMSRLCQCQQWTWRGKRNEFSGRLRIRMSSIDSMCKLQRSMIGLFLSHGCHILSHFTSTYEQHGTERSKP